MTAAHGHAALFGVYGMLGIGLMLFCLRGLYDRAPARRPAAQARLLEPEHRPGDDGVPVAAAGRHLPGLGQHHARACGTRARRRSSTRSVMETLVWLRVPGDIVFAVGSVLLAVYALKLLRRPAAGATAPRRPLAAR